MAFDIVLLILEGMNFPCLLSYSFRPSGVVHESLSIIKEVRNLNRREGQEKSIRLEGFVSLASSYFKFIHPMEPKQTQDQIELSHVVEVFFNIFLPKLYFRVKAALRLGKVDHIIRNVIPYYPGYLYAIIDKFFSQAHGRIGIPAADIQNGNWLLVSMIFVGNYFCKVVYGYFVEIPLYMVHFWVFLVNFFLGYVKLQDFLDDFSNNFHEICSCCLIIVV